MELNENGIVFNGVVYEDSIVPIRDYLQSSSPNALEFDLRECDDIHLGALQLLLAYKRLYSAEFLFLDRNKGFVKMCDGFESDE